MELFLAGDLLEQCIAAIEKRPALAIPVNREGVNTQVLGFANLFAQDPWILAVVADVNVVWITEPRLVVGEQLGPTPLIIGNVLIDCLPHTGVVAPTRDEADQQDQDEQWCLEALHFQVSGSLTMKTCKQELSPELSGVRLPLTA